MDNSEYYVDLLLKYKNKGLLVDSNLLLVYFIGNYCPEQIKKFKRTIQFTIQDYSAISKIINSFEKLITTPHILTEVYNLSNQLPEYIKTEYFSEFKRQVDILEEKYIPSRQICSLDYFVKLGLSDSAIVGLSNHKYLVLTVDFPLSGYLHKQKIDVINFNHIRKYFWK